MKKTIMVALALLVVGATFNSTRAQQAPATRIDSLSYSIGMAQTQGLKDYLAKQSASSRTTFPLPYLIANPSLQSPG